MVEDIIILHRPYGLEIKRNELFSVNKVIIFLLSNDFPRGGLVGRVKVGVGKVIVVARFG